MRRSAGSGVSERLAAWLEAGAPTRDLRAAGVSVAVARAAVVVMLVPFIFWADFQHREAALTIVVLVAIAQVAWCGTWVWRERPLSALSAALSMAGDAVAIVAGIYFTGGPRSPAMLALALTLTVTALWVGWRTAVPLLVGSTVAVVAMGIVGAEEMLALTDAQATLTGVIVLTGFVWLSGNFARRQRDALGRVSDAVFRASRDALTGLLNRSALEERLAEEVARADRYGGRLSLLMIDLDDFKAVNDRLGHPAGDSALVGVAHEISREKRLSDVAARFGGEEFVLLLPETDEWRAATIGERLRARIAETAPGGVDLTVSVGVACVPVHAADAPSLVNAADRALYAAKHGGKDRVVVAHPLGEVNGTGMPKGVREPEHGA